MTQITISGRVSFGIILCIGISSIIISQNYQTSCDHVDIGVKLSAHQFLLGFGIANLVCIVGIPSIILALSIGDCFNGMMIFTFLSLLCYSLFSLIWFIIGGVILFRSNKDCINVGSVPVCYALAIWIIMAINLCCTTKELNNQNERV